MRFEFDDVTLDTADRIVTIRGERLHPPPRVLTTLQTLVERHGRVVSREELKAAVWPDTHVEPNSISQAVKAVRDMLAGSGAGGRIQTVPRQGYCFAGPVKTVVDPDPEALPRPAARSRPASVPWLKITVAASTIGAAFFLGMLTRQNSREGLAPEAAAFYQEGSALLASRRAPDLRRAAERFSRAVSADPGNYEALTALAQTEHLLAFYGLAGDREVVRQGLDAASRAIALDPARARAYAVRAAIALDTEWNLADSAADFGRAMRLDPADPLTRHWGAWWCLAAGRMVDARAMVDSAVRLDPFSPVVLTARATFAYLDGDFASAAADARHALTLDPDFFRAHLRLGLVELAYGEVTSGVRRLERAHSLEPDVPETVAALAHAYATTGRADRARRMLAEQGSRLTAYDRAIVFTGLGQDEQALAALVTARRDRQLIPGLFSHEPRLSPLRSYLPFQELESALAAARTADADGATAVMGRPLHPSSIWRRRSPLSSRF